MGSNPTLSASNPPTGAKLRRCDTSVVGTDSRHLLRRDPVHLRMPHLVFPETAALLAEAGVVKACFDHSPLLLSSCSRSPFALSGACPTIFNSPLDRRMEAPLFDSIRAAAHKRAERFEKQYHAHLDAGDLFRANATFSRGARNRPRLLGSACYFGLSTFVKEPVRWQQNLAGASPVGSLR